MVKRGDKVAITGGSSGIGLATARACAAAGADVALLARNAERLEKARQEVAAVAGAGKVVAVQADVCDNESVLRAASEVLSELGGLDLLVANAGYAQAAPIWDLPVETYERLIDTNYLGHVRVVHAFVDHFRRQGSGAICLVTSMLGFMSFYGYGAYSGSKYAIAGFGEALRQEMLPSGVSVHVFYPPTTDTPGLEAENETKPALTWAIEGSSRKFTADEVAAVMLSGIGRGKFTQMIGADSWAIFWLMRVAPGLVRWVLDRQLRAHDAASA